MNRAEHLRDTKELELLVKKWRDDGIRLNGGADKPYSDDENSVRAFVLEHCAEELAAALAKAQEGGMEFRACVCHNDSDKRLCLHKADCSVVEAQSSLTAKQKAPEGDGIVLCRECGKPTMHMGTLCFHCSKSDSAAPDGGDVEQRAKEILGDEYKSAHDADPSINFCHPEYQVALRAVIAALRQPAQVVVEEPIFHLRGYGDVTKEELERLAVPQAAPVPVEGEAVLWVHPGEIEAARRVKETLNGDGCVVASVFPRKEYVSLYYAPPPEQPAVELGDWINDPDSIPKKIINSCRDAILIEFGNNGTDGYYKRILARVFVAIIDAAKAGKGEGHG